MAGVAKKVTKTGEYSLQETPWYFGAYLNMARHNAYLISNEINTKFNLGRSIGNEEDIAQSFLTDKNLIEKNNANLIYSNLIRYLTSTRIFSSDLLGKDLKEDADFQGVDLSGMTTFLKIAFKELNAFRNDYSHYYSATNLDKRKTALDEDLAYFIRKIFAYAISFTKARFKNVLPDSSFKLVEEQIAYELINSENEFSDRGLAFFCSLFLDKENAFHFFNKITGFKDTRTFDFLATREVFTVFCVKLPHDKFVSDNPHQALQLDILNYLNRAPKELYHSLTSEGKKLFEPHLSDLTKTAIETNSINETIEEESYETYMTAISSKKRSEDRFAAFALKYLDQSDTFIFDFHIHLGKSKIKSYPKPLLGQTPTGNNRNIIHDIKTFGRLSTFLEKASKANIIDEREFKNLFTGDDIEYFTQYAPRYHVSNNKIGLLSATNRKYYAKLFRPIVPDAFLSIHELPKVALLEVLEKGKAAQLITEFIKKNKTKIWNKEFIEEIKNNLAFEDVLYKSFFDERLQVIEATKSKAPEIKALDKKLESLRKEPKGFQTDRTIKKILDQRKSLQYSQYVYEVNQRKTTLNTILSAHGIDVKQIPERIVNYWLNIVEVKKETTIKNKIRAARKECKQRLKDMEKGKAPKIGEMATFLARDIVNHIIDKRVKNKITSFYYDLLQACLALFADPKRKRFFLDVCSELNLFDNEVGHPFLSVINFNKITKTKDLYKIYIELKGTKEDVITDKHGRKKTIQNNWLYNTFYTLGTNEKTNKEETIIKLPFNELKIPTYYTNLNKTKADMDTWLSSVKNGNDRNPNTKPIDLPTNLFDEALIDILKKKIGINSDDGRKYNYSKLLTLWKNETQPFYDLERDYIIFKDQPFQANVKFIPHTAQKFSDYYSSQINQTFKIRKKIDRRIQKKQVENVFKRAIDENEKAIRSYQTKDRITLLMLNDLIGRDLQMSLNEIAPDSAQSPLNATIDIRQSIHGKTIVDSRKRKDFSIFRKLMADRRLPSLFTYYDSQTITFDELRNELYDYDRYKEQVFKMIFELERAIIHLMSEEELSDLKKQGKPNIQHPPYLEWLLKYGIINEYEKSYCHDIRRKFSHNEFPDKEVINKFGISFEKGKSFSAQIGTSYVNFIKEMIKNKLSY